MHRTSKIAAAALTVGMILGTPTTALAAVSAKDTLSQSDIIAAVPDTTGGSFTTTKVKKFAVPGKTCATTKFIKAKSSVSSSGSSTTGFPAVNAATSELASVSQAKKFMSDYKKFVARCKTFTEPDTGASTTVTAIKAPKLGEERVAIEQTITITDLNTNAYAASMLIRDGNRIGQVTVIDDAVIPLDQLNSLAKIAAKKMR